VGPAPLHGAVPPVPSRPTARAAVEHRPPSRAPLALNDRRPLTWPNPPPCPPPALAPTAPPVASSSAAMPLGRRATLRAAPPATPPTTGPTASRGSSRCARPRRWPPARVAQRARREGAFRASFLCHAWWCVVVGRGGGGGGAAEGAAQRRATNAAVDELTACSHRAARPPSPRLPAQNDPDPSSWALEYIKEQCPTAKWAGSNPGALSPKFVPQDSTTPDICERSGLPGARAGLPGARPRECCGVSLRRPPPPACCVCQHAAAAQLLAAASHAPRPFSPPLPGPGRAPPPPWRGARLDPGA
jgi:hypothetical protein